MQSNSRTSYLAVIGASLMHHSTATVDLGWHAPNATHINNLTQVIGGAGTYGFIYNASTVGPNEYGVYNWCNMPHVRAAEYPKPSADYKLQYVEVVCIEVGQIVQLLIVMPRSTDITSELYTPQTHSPSNLTNGIVTMRDYSTMDSQRLDRNQHMPTGSNSYLLKIPIYLQAFLDRANFHKSLLGVWMIHGSMERICMGCTMIY
jgi:hypothetical protein